MNKQELNALIEQALATKDWTSPYIEIKNAASGQKYRGINTLILPSIMAQRGHTCPMFATFNQAKEKGWQVKKGAKAYQVVYWNFVKVQDKDNAEEAKAIPFLKYFNVFNIADLEGAEIPTDGQDFTKTQQENAAKLQTYLKTNNIQTISQIGTAFYSPAKDIINLPPNLVDGEYTKNAVLAHEAAHSTGHESRLNRFTAANSHFASKEYSIEELTAEFTAYMLGFNAPDSCLAYIGSWIRNLQASERMAEAAKAWKQALKAFDLITGAQNDNLPLQS